MGPAFVWFLGMLLLNVFTLRLTIRNLLAARAAPPPPDSEPPFDRRAGEYWPYLMPWAAVIVWSFITLAGTIAVGMAALGTQ